MRFQHLRAFQKHLHETAAAGRLSRVYLIAASDDYERQQLLQSVAKLLPLAGERPVQVSAADSTLGELLTAIDSPSLFGSEPVAWVDEVEKLSKKQTAPLIDWMGRMSTGYLLLGSRGKTPLVGAVEQAGVVFDLLDEKPWDKEKRLAELLADRAKQGGKRLGADATALLFERLDRNWALLEKELDKLISFVGDRPSIERADVLQISAASRSHTLWQLAEELVWDGGDLNGFDSASFHGLIPALRSQFQLGLKIASLLEAQTPPQEMSSRLPKIWPKTLDKRTMQTARLGTPFFLKGLKLLFEIETLSRGSAIEPTVLLDYLRAYLHQLYTGSSPKAP